MSKIKKPILCDVDGVLGDFVQHCLNYAKSVGVDVPLKETVLKDTRQYDWWDKADLSAAAMKQGFCSGIPVIEGAQEFIENIRSLGHPVIFLTSPYKNHPYWHWERFKWLEKNFNIKRTDLIFATDKRYVNGVILLDDNVGNVLHWQEYQNEQAVLVKQPWNTDILDDCSQSNFAKPYFNTEILWHKKKKMTVLRTNDWKDIFDIVRMSVEECSDTQEKKTAP